MTQILNLALLPPDTVGELHFLAPMTKGSVEFTERMAWRAVVQPDCRLQRGTLGGIGRAERGPAARMAVA